METYKKTDDKIRLGYDHVKKNELIKACDIWLDAWEDIKAIFIEEKLETLAVSDNLTIENTKRAIAESYYALGNSEECDRLYTNRLKEDPHWGWGYIAR